MTESTGTEAATTDRPAVPPSVSLPGHTFTPRTDEPARLLLLAVRLLFFTLLITASMLPFIGTLSEEEGFEVSHFIGPFLATVAFGFLVLILDWKTPNKRLGTVFAIYLGVTTGLVGAFAVGTLLNLIADSWDLKKNAVMLGYLSVARLAIGITLCYIAVSVVLTTKDDFRLIIPYVEFSRQVRGVRPILLDTSVLIDGRIESLGKTGFADAPFIIPEFVIDELQQLADSTDKLKRDRGRRGLSIVTDLQQSAYMDVSIEATEEETGSVDHRLLRMADEENYRILTTDFNLEKVARIQSVSVVNLNDIANALKAQVLPGDELRLDVIRKGESPDQGIGYLPDGTMVVVVGGADDVGKSVNAQVTNTLQTGAGRMVFAQKHGTSSAPTDANPESMARSATQQPRETGGPPKSRPGKSSRNPRR